VTNDSAPSPVQAERNADHAAQINAVEAAVVARLERHEALLTELVNANAAHDFEARLAGALSARDETDAAKRRRLIERTMAGAITKMKMQLKAQAFAGWLQGLVSVI
jgi:hypothetical protein